MASAPTERPDEWTSAALDFEAMSQPEREQRLAEVSADLDLQLASISGLEEALGGPQATDAALAAVSSALIAAVEQEQPVPDFGRFGAPPAIDRAEMGGGMLFGSWLLTVLGAKGIVSATNGAEPGQSEQDKTSSTADGVTTTRELSGSIDSAISDVTVEATKEGVTGTMRSKVEIHPCPDANGEWTAHIVMSTSATEAGGRTGGNQTFDFTVTGTIDDDARLVGYVVDNTAQVAQFVASKGEFAETKSRIAYGSDGKTTSVTLTVTRSGGAATSGFVEGVAMAGILTEGMMLQLGVLEAVRSGWESGRCVEVAADPSAKSGLAPSSPVDIAVAPTSKLDGQATGGSITAQLSGGTSIDPSGVKVPADATFAYVAPGKINEQATVAFEARSRRGVGRTEARFDTKVSEDFTVSGSVPFMTTTLKFAGKACPISEPFTLKLTGAYVGTMAFDGRGSRGGRWTVKAKVFNAPFKVKGSGEYTVNLAEDGASGTIDLMFTTTIVIPVVGDQTGGAPISLDLTAGGC